MKVSVKRRYQLRNIIGHFKTVCTHKGWVLYYSLYAGIPWRGLKHDMSKFSPVEFLESALYYCGGTHSPIEECKKVNNGVSKAWLHHKGHNDHHYQYWIDGDGHAMQMSYKAATEMICDRIAAARTYWGVNFTFRKVLEYAQKNLLPERETADPDFVIHPQTRMYLLKVLELIAEADDNDIMDKEWKKYISPTVTKRVYKEAERKVRKLESKKS